MNKKSIFIISILTILLIVFSTVLYFKFIKQYKYMELRDGLTIKTWYGGERSVVNLNNPRDVDKADKVLDKYWKERIEKNISEKLPELSEFESRTKGGIISARQVGVPDEK